MGYQESFIGGSPAKFNSLRNIVVENGKEYYDDIGVYVHLVITLNKNAPLLGKAGNKFFYVCGERYPQNHLDEFLNEKDCDGARVIFCEELPDHISKNGYDDDKIYPDMKTEYFTVESFDFK